MTVKEFFAINDEDSLETIKAIMDAVKGRPYIGGYKTREFVNYPFWKLLNARKYYKEQNIYHLCSLTLGIGHRELLAADYRALVYYLRFVRDQMQQVQALEAKLNKEHADEIDEISRLEAAGISEMNIFEELNLIDELAGGDPLKWEAIQALPYKAVYTKLLRNKIKGRVNRRYQQLLKPSKNS